MDVAEQPILLTDPRHFKNLFWTRVGRGHSISPPGVGGTRVITKERAIALRQKGRLDSPGDSSLAGCGKTRLLRHTPRSVHVACWYQNRSQDAQKGRPARPQRAKRRIVLSAVRGASERCENAAGGLFPHPARVKGALSLGGGVFKRIILSFPDHY